MYIYIYIYIYTYYPAPQASKDDDVVVDKALRRPEDR